MTFYLRLRAFPAIRYDG